MENREEYQPSLFACPSCGTDVNEDATKCPGCDAIFVEDGITQSIPPNKEEQRKEPWKENQIEYPPPPSWTEKRTDNQDSSKDIAKPQIDQSEPSHPNEDKSMAIREFSGSLSIHPEGNKEDSKSQSEDITGQSEPDVTEEENEHQVEPENTGDVEVDVSKEMHELKRLDDKINLHNELLIEESQPENRVMAALNEYNTNRRKRYFTGTLFVGIGVILFVLLWLVVVYDVLVQETQAWFGAHIILIMVVAGIFFTFGLYMILTYPKSSLIEILAYMTEVKHKRKTSDY